MAEDTESLVTTCSSPSLSDNALGTALQGRLRQQLQVELRKIYQEKDAVNAKLNKKIDAVLTILGGVKEDVQET